MKDLVALIVPEPYQNAEKPVTAIFKGTESSFIRKQNFEALIIDTISDDSEFRTAEQRRMAKELDHYVCELSRDPNTKIQITCYDYSAAPVRNKDAIETAVTPMLSLTDKIAPYFYEKDLDGQKYDVIDFMVSPVTNGG